MGRPNWRRVRGVLGRDVETPAGAPARPRRPRRAAPGRGSARSMAGSASGPAGPTAPSSVHPADRREGRSWAAPSIGPPRPASRRTHSVIPPPSTGASTKVTAVAPLSDRRTVRAPTTSSPPSVRAGRRPDRAGAPRAAVGRRRRADERRRAAPVDHRGQELLARRRPRSATTAPTSDGGRPRARRGRPAQLLGHHGQLHQSRACPPNSSGRWIPSVPWAARSSQNGGSVSARSVERGRGRRQQAARLAPTLAESAGAPRAPRGSRWARSGSE